MTNGTVAGIYIAPKAGEKMKMVKEVRAVRGKGLEGDRYFKGEGSFNKKSGVGKRQVTFMNAKFFYRTGYRPRDSRRNIFTDYIELMYLIGKRFQVGEAWFRGMKYCDPCDRPTELGGKKRSFKDRFFERGGLIAKVVKGGMIRQGDPIIPPSKSY